MTGPLDELIRGLDAAIVVLGESSAPQDRGWANHLQADAKMLRLLAQTDRWRGEGGG